jgi:hypothetical protein
VLFSYKDQKYICSEGIQREITFLDKREIKKIVTKDSLFFIVVCKKYDKYYDVYCTSWDQDFKMNVSRQIEPDILRVFDLLISGSHLSIISAKD